MVNLCGTRLQTSIHKKLGSFIDRLARDIPVTASQTIQTKIIFKSRTQLSWAYQPLKLVIISYIDNHSRITLWFSIVQGPHIVNALLMLGSHSFSEWCRERLTFSLDYKGGLYIIYECLQRIAAHITQDAGRKIYDAPFTLIFRLGNGPYVILFWIWWRPKNWERTMTYQTEYVAIDSRISGCDHK